MRRLRILFIFVVIVALVPLVFAGEQKRTAEVIDLEGAAQVKLRVNDGWLPIEEGMVLHEGDILRTNPGSYLNLRISGEVQTATVEMEENSQLMLSELAGFEEETSQKTLLDLAIGKILIKVEKLKDSGSKFEVKTPTSIVGVRGTVFIVEVEGLK